MGFTALMHKVLIIFTWILSVSLSVLLLIDSISFLLTLIIGAGFILSWLLYLYVYKKSTSFKTNKTLDSLISWLVIYGVVSVWSRFGATTNNFFIKTDKILLSTGVILSYWFMFQIFIDKKYKATSADKSLLIQTTLVLSAVLVKYYSVKIA